MGIPGDPVVLHDESPDCWKCIYNVGQLAILSSSGPAPATANNSQDQGPALPSLHLYSYNAYLYAHKNSAVDLLWVEYVPCLKVSAKLQLPDTVSSAK